MDIKDNVVPAMLLAPSAHNTQPWIFSIRSHGIDIHVDMKRHLAVSDPTGRQLCISLGCAVTNGATAAACYGYATEIDVEVVGNDISTLVIHMTFTAEKENSELADLCQAAEYRRTDRSIYDGRPLTDQERAELPTLKDPLVKTITKKENKEIIAQATQEGTVDTLSRKDFKTELSHWIRNSWTRQPDGMPGYAIKMPTPVSFIGPLMIRFAPIHNKQGPESYKEMSSASLIAVIATEGDTVKDWVQAGQVMERLWLEVATAGLAAAPLATAIEAGPHLREKVRQIIGGQLYPQAIFRIGHSKQKNLKATPRRSLDDVAKGSWK